MAKKKAKVTRKTKAKKKTPASKKPQANETAISANQSSAGTPKIEIPQTEPHAEQAHIPRTVGSMMGEIVWLMSQSPAHRFLSLADLEWLLMPPIVLGQYKLFRDPNKKPAGAALWGYLSEAAEQRLKAAGRLAPQDWGNNAQLDPERGLIRKEGGILWLVELIAPFHNEQNQQRQQMLADLMQTAFKGQEVKMMHLNTKTNQREELVLRNKDQAPK